MAAQPGDCMKSVCTLQLFERLLFDGYEPAKRKNVTKFLNRVATGPDSHPTCDIKAFRLYENRYINELK
jgi:hypothetical protein